MRRVQAHTAGFVVALTVGSKKTQIIFVELWGGLQYNYKQTEGNFKEVT